MWRKNGMISKMRTLKKLLINGVMRSVEAKEIARNENINIVSRIAFLRKYCELHKEQ